MRILCESDDHFRRLCAGESSSSKFSHQKECFKCSRGATAACLTFLAAAGVFVLVAVAAVVVGDSNIVRYDK